MTRFHQQHLVAWIVLGYVGDGDGYGAGDGDGDGDGVIDLI